MNTHFALVTGTLLCTVWVVRLYLIIAAYREYAKEHKTQDGYETTPGASLWSAGSNQIAESLGPSGDGGEGSWCTACGIGQKKPCSNRCWGEAGRSNTTLKAGVVVPAGTLKDTIAGCQDLCRAQKKCQAWEYDDVTNSCFTYALSSYPPTYDETNLQSITSGYAVDTVVPVALMRQFASTVLFLIPLLLLYVAYRNFYYPSPDMDVALSTAVPLLTSGAMMAYLQLVGFQESSPVIEFQCNALLNQRCRADAITGSRRSGTCYNGCCGATISCKIDEGIWSTCTWPNVMCADGSCALNADHCKQIGEGKGIHPGGSACTSGGSASTRNGGDYNPTGDDSFVGPCYVGDDPPTQFPEPDILIQNAWTVSADTKQYRGEPNCDLPEIVRQETGTDCLSPGRSDNVGVSDPTKTGSVVTDKYPVFSMNEKLHQFLMRTFTGNRDLSTQGRMSPGCGLAQNPARGNQEAIFLVPSPGSLSCMVPSK